MKKKLSLLMVMMMTMSLIPFSAFAAEDSENVYVQDGAPKVAQTYDNEELTVVIDVGEYTSLKEGYVNFKLKNAYLANVSEPISYKLVQSGKEITSGTTLRFETVFQKPLDGGENEFVMKISGNTLENKSKDNIEIFLMMKLDFRESSLGDVNLEITDRDQTGVKNHVETIAYQVGEMQRDMNIRVNDDQMRIGKNGGALSAFMIERMDRLDSVSSNNEVLITLSDGVSFGTDTEVTLDSKAITPRYNSDRTQMSITGVNSANRFITVVPEIETDRDVEYGNVMVTVDYEVRNRTIHSKEAKIGRITDNSPDIEVKEQGKTAIPAMQSGQTKTVEVTVSGIEDTFPKNGYIDFNVDGAYVVFKGVSIQSPKGQVMVLGESEGKETRNLVNGKEVYRDGEFTIKLLESGNRSVTFLMDITSDPAQSGKAIMEVSADHFSTKKLEIAEISSKFSVTAPMTNFGQKGTSSKTNDIKIRESKLGTLNTGDKLYFNLDNPQMGFDISEMTVSATGGLELSKPKLDSDSNVEIRVLKGGLSSASTITLSGIKVYSLETVVSGIANLEIMVNDDTIFEAPYVTILGMAKTMTVFKIGDKNYTVSGLVKQATEAPYINGGYTMLPVRALADGLGLSSNWNNETKTATFSDKTRTAVVKLGATEMTVNGVSYRLAVPAEIKNGATMIELRSLANAFGVSIAWDNAQKTATVTN